MGYSIANNPPAGFKKKKAKGLVVISFVVKEDGELSDIEVLKGIEKSCDQFIFELVKNSGKWLPALQEGKPISSTLSLPVRFNHK